MTLDQKVGQLIVPSFRSTYLSSDSETYEELVSLVHEQHVGGFLLFGGRERVPDVLLSARSLSYTHLTLPTILLV